MSKFVVFVTIAQDAPEPKGGQVQTFVLPELFETKELATASMYKAFVFYAKYYNLELDYATNDAMFASEASGFGLVRTLTIGVDTTDLRY